MIVDTLSNAHYYEQLNSGFKKGFDFLINSDLQKLTPGKHEIDGNNVFASVSEYETKNFASGRFEAHRQYIDVQYVAKGIERLYFTPLQNTKELETYNNDKDLEFLSTVGNNINFVVSDPNSFVIFFPTDAHMPNISHIEKSNVKKIVIKVRI